VFSLDVFGENYGFWGTIWGLFMHNLPVLFLLAILLISWKYEIIGGIGFILFGALYILFAIIPIQEYSLSWSLMIGGLALIIGILFLFNWLRKIR